MNQTRMLFHRFLISHFQTIRSETSDYEVSKLKWYNEMFASIAQVIGEEKDFPDHALLFFLQYASKIIEQRGKEITEKTNPKDIRFEIKREQLKTLKTLHQQMKSSIQSYESILKEREL